MPLHAFDFVTDLPERSASKPRARGLTGMLDYGWGLAHVADILELAGHVIDIAKLATATARIYPEDKLREKLALYRRSEVRSLMGGQFCEYLYYMEGLSGAKRLFAEAQRVGFDLVEVSDTCEPIAPDVRRALVEAALEAGVSVVCEVGQLSGQGDADQLVSDARNSLAFGASYVIVEGAELVTKVGSRTELMRRFKQELPLHRLIFELPGPGIGDAGLAEVAATKQTLVREFGPDVNLANIPLDQVVETEVVRLGIEDSSGWAGLRAQRTAKAE